MMKRLLIYLMLLAFAIPPAIAGEKTVTISRNEGIYDDGTGVYYCTKGGVTMTFSSGLNNVNYLVEHQQVVFDIFTTNYVIKKIKFNCLDNTTNQDETFYWGPSTIHELGAVATYVPTGTYTYNGFVGTWVGGSTPSKYVKFVTEARPVRFGSVEITYDKEYGDIYEKVTSNDEIEDGQTYALVSQYASKALGKEDYYGTDNLTTFTSTPVTLLDNNNKVKVTDEVQLIKLQSTGYSSRPWYIKVGDNYMRRRSGDPSGSSSGAAYGQGYNLYSVGSVTNYEQYFRVSISVSGNTNQNALIRFEHNSTETAGGKTFAIRHYNGGSLFRDMDFSSNNQYAANQRVYLYKPAQSYEVITECIPTNGGYITLGGGILTDDQGKNWSQHFDNVTFFVGTANGYGIGEVTLTDINTRAVTILQPTATSDFGNDYSFEMPSNDVKITANFVQPYDIHTVINPNDDSGSFEFIDGYTDFNGQPKSNEGKTVTFKPVPTDGYSFNSVTITDDVTGETTTMTPDADGVYSFVMPGNSVTLTANFEAAHDLYLLGTANGRTGWVPYGPKFTFDGVNEKYYIDVYFKGGNDDPNTDPAYGYFSLTKRISDPANPNWNDLNGFRLAAETNQYWVADGYTGVPLYNDRPDNSFKIKPGVYRIEVNAAMTQLSIIEYPLTVTFDPVSGTVVEPNDNVSFTSNLNDLVHAINSQEDPASYSSTDNWGVQASGNTHPITHDGITTVTGQSSIGYITATGTADYEIIGDLYLLGTANGETGWHPYGPKFTYDEANEEYYIDVYFKGGNDDPNTDPAYGYFSLTKRISDPANPNWNDLNGFRLAAENNNTWVEDGYTGVALYGDRPDNAFKIKPGVYRIKVNKAKTQMSIIEYPLTLTFNPVSGTTVAAGATVDISSNLNDLVHGINADEVDATFKYATSTDGTLPTPNIVGSTVTIEAEGATTTVNAEASIGYIVVPGNANYTVPAPTLYSITTQVNPAEAGTITTSTSGAAEGATVDFTVTDTDASVYTLIGVEVVDSNNGIVQSFEPNSTGSYSFTMPDDNVTIHADYQRTPYNVTTSWSPSAGGSVWLNGVNTPQTVTVPNADPVVFGVAPAAGYALNSLTVTNTATGQEITPTPTGTSNEYSFTMPAGNVTIVANFSELAKYNIHTTVTPENGGTFNVQNRAYVGETVNFTFVYNQSQAFDDYYLYSLTVTNESTGETVALTHLSGLDYRFVMPDADVTIAAVLKKTHQVTTSWTPQNGGYVGLMDHLGNTFTSLTYGMDDTVKFIVTPNPGFVMSSLVVDYGAIEPTFNEDGGYYTFVMPDKHVLVRATFVIKGEYQVTLVNNPNEGGSMTATGHVKIENGNLYSDEGMTVVITPTPSNDWLFDDISAQDENGNPVELTSNGDGTYTMVMPAANVTVTANYHEVPEYNISTDYDPQQGSITLTGIASDSKAYPGETVTFTVEGSLWKYRIEEVYVTVDGTNPEVVLPIIPDKLNDYHINYSFTMPGGDVTVHARFKRLYKVQLYWIPENSDRGQLPYGADTVFVYKEGGYRLTRKLVYLEPGNKAIIDISNLWDDAEHGNYTIEYCRADAIDDNNNWLYEVIPPVGQEGFEIIGDRDYRMSFVMPEHDVNVYIILRAHTTLKFIESSEFIPDGTPVVVSDELIGTWSAQDALWAKDQVESFNKTENDGGYDYVTDELHLQKKPWNQNNSVLIRFDEYISDNLDNPDDAQEKENIYIAIEEFVDNYIKEGSIIGTFHCSGNYYSEAIYGGTDDPHNHKAAFEIWVEEMPEHVPGYVNNPSLGYPGYIPDPREDPKSEGGYYDDPIEYNYNHYTPSNFCATNIAGRSGLYPDGGNVVGPQAPDSLQNKQIFFMNPKDQEIAQVWAVYAGHVNNVSVVTSPKCYPEQRIETLSGELFTTYKYLVENGSSYNRHDFTGYFIVADADEESDNYDGNPNGGWRYNRLSENRFHYGKPIGDKELTINNAYLFHVAVEEIGIHSQVPRAPRRAPQAKDLPEGALQLPFKVYPLDLYDPTKNYTAVREIRPQDSVEIVDIRYYNVMGQESKTPFDGINIIVTRYADGSSSVLKVLR